MKQDGLVTLIYGPMFAGKSDELINIYNKLLSEDENFEKKVLVFKSIIDTRSEVITSRTGNFLKCKLLNSEKEIFDYINDETKYIFIDEFQFMNLELVKVIAKLKKNGINIFLSGLNKNFKKLDFPIFTEMMEIADSLIFITARCHDCGKVAKYSRKLVNGLPPERDSKTIEIDLFKNSEITYKASCSKCYR